MNARALMMNGGIGRDLSVIPGHAASRTRNDGVSREQGRDQKMKAPLGRLIYFNESPGYQPNPKSKPSGNGAGA
jgi:hypothetical protein